MTKPTIVLLLALLALLPGCGAGCGKGSRGSDRLAVSVSIFPIYDLARRVAGPDADVALVLPPGRDEHAYAPTPKDVETATHARVGVMVGLGLDPWMETLMADAAPKARLIKVGDRVPTLTLKDDALATDPHVWLDPERARLIVRAIAEELGKADSAHAIAYRKRATELDTSLAALDKEVEARTRALTTRGLVTLHGGFQYFAERYKLEIDAAPAGALAQQAKVPLDPLGGGSETDSYEKLIRYDVAQLEKHLRAP